MLLKSTTTVVKWNATGGGGFHTLDLLLGEGRKLNLCATDDAHFAGPDYFGGWVMVKAQANDPELLLTALKSGHYYSTQGPEFKSIRWASEEVEIECSASRSIIVQGQGSATAAIHGESVTKGKIKLTRLEDSTWMRVTIVDSAGKKAWSNPVWKEDIA